MRAYLGREGWGGCGGKEVISGRGEGFAKEAEMGKGKAFMVRKC